MQELQSMLQMCVDIVSGETGLMDRKCFKPSNEQPSSIDPSMEELSKRANSLQIEADDQELQALSGGFDFDPEMIESNDQPNDHLAGIKTKIRRQFRKFIGRETSLENKIAMQSDIEDRLKSLAEMY